MWMSYVDSVCMARLKSVVFVHYLCNVIDDLCQLFTDTCTLPIKGLFLSFE